MVLSHRNWKITCLSYFPFFKKNMFFWRRRASCPICCYWHSLCIKYATDLECRLKRTVSIRLKLTILSDHMNEQTVYCWLCTFQYNPYGWTWYEATYFCDEKHFLRFVSIIFEQVVYTSDTENCARNLSLKGHQRWRHRYMLYTIANPPSHLY